MSAWTIIPLVLGVLGIGGGAAFLLLGGGGALAAFGFLRLLPSPAAVWRFLTHPIGVVLTMIALSGGFWLAGSVHGKRIGRAECETRIEESRRNAAAADARIAAEAAAAAALQKREAAARETAIKDEVTRYVEELAKRTGESCRAGDDAARWNDGLGVQDDSGVPAVVPLPPARPGRGAVPRLVPQGPGVR